MATESYKDLILLGEKERETGDPTKALLIFEKALALASKPSEVADTLRHMGLCHEHLGYLGIAREYYEIALETCEKAQDLGGMARTKRHLSSVALKQWKITEAYNLGVAARNDMMKLPTIPNDIVWITHGIVKVLIDAKRPKKEVRRWTVVEWHDLRYMWPREKNLIRRRVWTTGWMMDAAYAWAPWTWFLIPVAFVYAAASGLRLRMRQMLTGKR